MSGSASRSKRPRSIDPGRCAASATAAPRPASQAEEVTRRVFVAVDIGHSHTGVAILDPAQGTDAAAFGADHPWDTARECKVPTVVLVDKEPPHGLVSFGPDAEIRWVSGSAQDKDYLLVDSFKLGLDQPEERLTGNEDKMRSIYAESKKGTGRNSTPVKLPLYLLYQRIYEAVKLALIEYAKDHGIDLEGCEIIFINTLPVQFTRIARVGGFVAEFFLDCEKKSLKFMLSRSCRISCAELPSTQNLSRKDLFRKDSALFWNPRWRCCIGLHRTPAKRTAVFAQL